MNRERLSEFVELIEGGSLRSLTALPGSSAQCCITSPPYYGLRDYGHPDQIGLEPTPELYVARLVEVFGEVRRVLRNDGTLWLNIGDSYGWYLRCDCIWEKPNQMPDSTEDRPTRSHEYLFLLSKSRRYRYDHEAIKEPAVCGHKGSSFVKGKTAHGKRDLGKKPRPSQKRGSFAGKNGSDAFRAIVEMRSKRSVWRVPTKKFPGAHFATFPPALIEPCILAGCPAGGVVIDPFAGSGTTGLECARHGRSSILLELNQDYCELIRERVATQERKTSGLFTGAIS